MSDTSVTKDKTPAPDQVSPRVRLLATVGALLALALASIDASVVSAAMPHVADDLHGLRLYSWVGMSYGVSSAVLIPIGGKLGDMFGRKPFLLAGVAGFMLFSLLCGLSGDMTELVIFRGIQGIFGGILMANVFTMLGDVYAAGRLAQMQGLFFSVAGLSMVIGPPLGGFITDTLSWRWVFYLNLPLGIIPLLAVAAIPFARAKATWRDIDFLGAGTLVAGLIPILVGLSLIGEGYAATSAPVLTLLIAGIVMLVVFFLVETRVVTNPIVPFGIFRTNQVAIMVTVGFFSAFAMAGTVYYVPLLYQGVLGVSAESSGNLLIPLTLALMLVPPVAGRALSRITRYRFLGTGAFSCMVAGLLLLARIGPDSGPLLPVVAMILVGVGIGITFPMATSVVQSALPMKMLGIGTSQVQFWRIIAGPVSLAVLGPILSSRIGDAGAHGSGRVIGVSPVELAGATHGLFIAAAILVAVGIIATLFLREVPLRAMTKAAPKKRRLQPTTSES